MKGHLLPDFLVEVGQACTGCGRCVRECSFGVLKLEEDRPMAVHSKCVACGRCVAFCPRQAIRVTPNEVAYRHNPYWTLSLRKELLRQAQTGGMLLAGAGNDLDYLVVWDHLLLDASQATNPSIDPLREPMEVVSFLGRKPASAGRRRCRPRSG